MEPLRNTTTSALLEGLRDPADPVWSQFDARLRPVLIGFAQRYGLNASDAADAAQETLSDFFVHYRTRYDRSRGRLRTWILSIARHKIADIRQARAKKLGTGAGSTENAPPMIEQTPAAERDAEDIWRAECKRFLLQRAMQELPDAGRIQPRTIRAFRMHALEGYAAAQVAQRLGMTTEAVYMAKHHCLQRLRTIVAELAELYEIEFEAIDGVIG